MRLKATIISLISVLLIAGVGIGVYCAIPAIKGTIDGSRYYTYDELQESYEKGYNDGCKTETELTGQVKYYKDIVDEYYINVNTLNDEIAMLTRQNENYQNQLRNAQTTSQNTINDLQTIINTNNEKINSLSTEINALKKSIAYYEQLVANIEIDNQAVVTFEFDGKVCNFQIIDRNTTVMVNDPVSTEYAIFNGWTVDEQPVDLNTYLVTTNTRFIADVIYKYNVNFVDNGVGVASQIVTKNSYATLPTTPQKSGYTFEGWSLDGINVIDVNGYAITENTTFIAVFTKLHTVTFMKGDSVVAVETVSNNAYVTAPEIQVDSKQIFNGWKVNNEIVNLDTYAITSDLIIVADIVKAEAYFVAIQSSSPATISSPSSIWTDGTNVYYSSSNNQFVLNKATMTWSTKTWNGVTPSYGYYIMRTASNVYYFDGYDVSVLDKQTSTWSAKTSAGYNTGTLWTDGNYIYRSINSYNQYRFNEATRKWDSITWNGFTDINGDDIWLDGDTVYYSKNGSHYVLDKSTNTWLSKTWYGCDFLRGQNIWSDGENCYYSCGGGYFGTAGQFVLDRETNTWVEKNWTGLTPAYANSIWTDGENYYYTSGTSTYKVVY